MKYHFDKAAHQIYEFRSRKNVLLNKVLNNSYDAQFYELFLW